MNKIKLIIFYLFISYFLIQNIRMGIGPNPNPHDTNNLKAISKIKN